MSAPTVIERLLAIGELLDALIVELTAESVERPAGQRAAHREGQR